MSKTTRTLQTTCLRKTPLDVTLATSKVLYVATQPKPTLMTVSNGKYSKEQADAAEPSAGPC